MLCPTHSPLLGRAGLLLVLAMCGCGETTFFVLLKIC